MKIYTRAGDDGGTRLLAGGDRASKADDRVEALGAVDAVNAAIGWAVAVIVTEIRDGAGDLSEIADLLELVQNDLFVLGSHVAIPPLAPGGRTPRVPPLPVERVEQMEEWIDAAEEELPPLTQFILPGGTAASAALHLARTACRTAERRVARMAGRVATKGAASAMGSETAAARTGEDDGPVAPPSDAEVMRYLNRLSDLLFVTARLANRRAGRDDVVWRQFPLV
ncbi:MAG: cob(I)yrinic acid a,c-diamide adenosyltransferase [Gemmatimonadetes bacterium]|nr:cob(I)yrinic acid a,c-diamide adenosyltransferase [Gemmatimonadota bacterium]